MLNTAPRLNLDDMEYYQTDLYDRMPYIIDYIKQHIADKTYRVQIWLIGNHGYLNWHNHASLPWHTDIIMNDKAIVHLPIRSDPNIRMLVRMDGKIYGEYYEPGNTYLFNNIKDHAVENNTNVDRIHVVAFVPYNDPKFVDLLERSMPDA